MYMIIFFWLSSLLFVGFTTANRACCGNGGQFAGIIPCGPTSSMCSERHKHVFWDPYHTSEAANLIFAKQLLDGDNRYIFPMNLRQLRDLWSSEFVYYITFAFELSVLRALDWLLYWLKHSYNLTSIIWFFFFSPIGIGFAFEYFEDNKWY